MRYVFSMMLGVMLWASVATAQDSTAELTARSKQLAAAWKTRDAAKIVEFYAEDAVLLESGQPMIKGRAAIRKSFEGSLDPGVAQMVDNPIEIKATGDIGYVFGTYTFPIKAAGKSGQQPGKYLEVWKRTAGVWRIAYDSASFDTPPSPSTK